MDSELRQRRLVRKRSGAFTVLWSDTTAFAVNRTYDVELIANGSALSVKVDGQQIASVTDSNHAQGTVALYTWNNDGAAFDDILVRNLAVPLANQVELQSDEAPSWGVASIEVSDPAKRKGFLPLLWPTATRGEELMMNRSLQ